MKTIYKDKIWGMWWNLPMCKLNRIHYNSEAKKRFNYDNCDMTIVAPNCIGGEIYNSLNLQFKTPFINTTIERNQFVDLAINFNEYMNGPLTYEGKNNQGELVASLQRFAIGRGINKILITFPHDIDAKKL